MNRVQVSGCRKRTIGIDVFINDKPEKGMNYSLHDKK